MGKVYQVIVFGFNGEKNYINLCNTEEQMQTMTVLQLKEKIQCLPGNEGGSPEDIHLIFTTKQLEDESTLVSYGIQNMSIIQMVLRVAGGGNEFQFNRAPIPSDYTVL